MKFVRRIRRCQFGNVAVELGRFCYFRWSCRLQNLGRQFAGDYVFARQSCNSFVESARVASWMAFVVRMYYPGITSGMRRTGQSGTPRLSHCLAFANPNCYYLHVRQRRSILLTFLNIPLIMNCFRNNPGNIADRAWQWHFCLLIRGFYNFRKYKSRKPFYDFMPGCQMLLKNLCI
jgi:hypothetical protein